jgi:putative transposase
LLHIVTKRIVEHAKANQFGIAMEKLKGIRKLCRKGNGQGKSYTGRMNSLTFREVQRQVEYKAAWVGLPIAWGQPKRHVSNMPELWLLACRTRGAEVDVPFMQKDRG